MQLTTSPSWHLCSNCTKARSRRSSTRHSKTTTALQGAPQVGRDSPFDHGQQQMKMLAGLEVTTKSVERTAEAIGRRHRPDADRTKISKIAHLFVGSGVIEPVARPSLVPV